MDIYEFFKEQYVHEHERRYAINESLSFPVGIVAALVSVVFFLVTTFNFNGGCHVLLFQLTIGLSMVALSVAVYNLVHAFSMSERLATYKGSYYPLELFEWHSNLVDEYYQQGKPVTEADEDLKQELIRVFAEHANHNQLLNDKKGSYIFLGKRYMVWGLVFVVLSCIPFGYNYYKQEPVIHNVKVVNTQEFGILETSQPGASLNHEQQGQAVTTTTTTTTSSSPTNSTASGEARTREGQEPTRLPPPSPPKK